MSDEERDYAWKHLMEHIQAALKNSRPLMDYSDYHNVQFATIGAPDGKIAVDNRPEFIYVQSTGNYSQLIFATSSQRVSLQQFPLHYRQPVVIGIPNSDAPDLEYQVIDVLERPWDTFPHIDPRRYR